MGATQRFSIWENVRRLIPDPKIHEKWLWLVWLMAWSPVL